MLTIVAMACDYDDDDISHSASNKQDYNSNTHKYETMVIHDTHHEHHDDSSQLRNSSLWSVVCVECFFFRSPGQAPYRST